MIRIDEIYNEDCLEGMKRIADRSVDAIVCDLPYGILNRRNWEARWDRPIPLAPLWEQYRRIIKPDSPVILFGQGMFTAKLLMSQPRLWRYNLVWYKDRASGHLNANRMPLRKHEDILVFYEHLPVYHPQMIPCDKSQRNHGRRTSQTFTNRCYGSMRMTDVRIADDKYPTSVIQIAKEHKTGAFYHPTQKPVALVEYLIRTYTDEGDVVLDNCMGAGTTAIAAIRSGRHYIGFETDAGYCRIAGERIKAERFKKTGTETEIENNNINNENNA
ncbi:DNA-methyltransferase [Parabacteroides merdae]|uniref:DNA-methyltransferase n=1 Tax=Parabacteroides merdae TaxID=46503 RepID=UPI0022E22CF7|nr:site-specific DNA-methyltransferase [Parabacteroides merdae]